MQDFGALDAIPADKLDEALIVAYALAGKDVPLELVEALEGPSGGLSEAPGPVAEAQAFIEQAEARKNGEEN